MRQLIREQKKGGLQQNQPGNELKARIQNYTSPKSPVGILFELQPKNCVHSKTGTKMKL